MSNPKEAYDENQETIQFYKIKLMEKEREISSFQAKFKKAQIKNNRDLKELKIAEQKASKALKEQRSKLDKSTKKIHELTEQNNILQHRMAELKDQKDKEIQATRNQYNHLKLEVRSYERILPTHTFLSELGATLEQLPTYQTVFMNWKDKSEIHEELQAKFKAFKLESEEKIAMQAKVQQNLKKKKNQLEKQLRDDMSKLLELQSQSTTLHMQRSELASKLESISDQLHNALVENDELTESNKNLQAKLDEFIIIHNSEMEAKEQEIRRITVQQMQKFQEELERISHSYDMKQNSHLQQLAFLEEEEMRLQDKILKDKERFEATYRQLYNEVQHIKQQLQAEKEEVLRQKIQADKLKRQLHDKNQENLRYLRKLGENEIKIEELQSVLRINAEKLAIHREKAEDNRQEASATRRQMQDKIAELENQNNKLHSQLYQRQNEILLLASDIEELKNRGQMMNRSSFPTGFPMDQGQIQFQRKRRDTEQSVEIDIIQEIQNPSSNLNIKNLEANIKTNMNINNRMRNNSAFSKNSNQYQYQYQYQYNKDEQKYDNFSKPKLFSQQQLDEKIKQVQDKVSLEIKQKQKQIDEIQQQYQEEIKGLKKTNQSLQYEKIKIQREYANDKQFYEDQLVKARKMYDLLKKQKNILEDDNIASTAQWKKDKEALNDLKGTNRELQKINKQLQRNKQQLQIQVDQLKKFRQKLQAKQLNKQKSSSSSENSSNTLKQMMEKYNAKINNLIKEKDEQSFLLTEKEAKVSELTILLSEKMKKYQNIEIQLEKKQRENKMLEGLLDHQRKDRTIRSVPSLDTLPDQDEQEQENFKQFYNQAGQKEGQIAILQRQIQTLKQEAEELKESNERRVNDMECQMTEYIQEIIRMKMVVAQSEMKASEKTHLYNQLKKKFEIK